MTSKVLCDQQMAVRLKELLKSTIVKLYVVQQKILKRLKFMWLRSGLRFVARKAMIRNEYIIRNLQMLQLRIKKKKTNKQRRSHEMV